MTAATPAFASDQRGADTGAYLRARAAAADGETRYAADQYGQALAAAPDNPLIAIRAYREAVVAGDMKLALTASRSLRTAGVAPPDSSLLLLADAVAKRNAKAARRFAAELANGPLDFLRPVIDAWLSFDEGANDPEKQLAGPSDNALARHFAQEHRGLLLIAQGEADRGMAVLEPLLADERGDLDLRLNAAQLLARRGDAELGKRLLSGNGTTLGMLRASLGDGTKASAAFGISRLYAELGNSLASDRLASLSILLEQSALVLDPDYDRARIALADALARQDHMPAAQAAIATISTDSPLALQVEREKLAILTRAGNYEDALGVAQDLAHRPGAGSEEWRAIGDIFSDQMRFADAAAAYGRAIDLAGAKPDWTLYLQRGGALEQAGDWGRALPLLQKAVQLAPDEPEALNYLGYAQIERGENLAAAQAMIERAHKLKPEDSAITDSLAWSYYQRGQPAKAVPLLEKAAKASPADPEINDHLGDAYWRTGRRYEARYAWRAAQRFAEASDADRIAAKIADGLPPAR